MHAVQLGLQRTRQHLCAQHCEPLQDLVDHLRVEVEMKE